MFGENDPVHFGGVGIAMLTLFQVSTLASWSDIAYISWFGCENYIGGPYIDGASDKIKTMAGDFLGYSCKKKEPDKLSLIYITYILNEKESYVLFFCLLV